MNNCFEGKGWRQEYRLHLQWPKYLFKYIHFLCNGPCYSLYFLFLADLGEARGCSTNISVINSLIQSSFVKISLRRRHALMVEDGAFSHKIDYVTIFKEILNLEGLYWFKSYGDFAEWVNFAYWWSFSSKGSASAACAAGLFLS